MGSITAISHESLEKPTTNCFQVKIYNFELCSSFPISYLPYPDSSIKQNILVSKNILIEEWYWDKISTFDQCNVIIIIWILRGNIIFNAIWTQDFSEWKDVPNRVGPNSDYGLNTWIPNYLVFENFTNTEYRIIHFLKMNEYQISNSTIRSQLIEYRILKNWIVAPPKKILYVKFVTKWDEGFLLYFLYTRVMGVKFTP